MSAVLNIHTVKQMRPGVSLTVAWTGRSLIRQLDGTGRTVASYWEEAARPLPLGRVDVELIDGQPVVWPVDGVLAAPVRRWFELRGPRALCDDEIANVWRVLMDPRR